MRLLLLTLLAAGLQAQAAIRVEAEVPRFAAEKAAVRAKAGAAREIRLDAPAAAKAVMPARAAGVPQQVGFGRELAGTGVAGATEQLEWQPLASGGRVAALRIVSPGAAALRLELVVRSLPEGATLRFHAPGGEVFEAAGSGIPRDTPWWSPVAEGEAIEMEVEVPAGGDAGAVRFSVPHLSHLVTSAAKNFRLPKVASACTIDASCYQSQWSVQSNATARILFTRNTATFVCTGTLLADEDPGSTIPYFLTANHCIGSQAEASTIVSYWFLRASDCNSGVPGPYRSMPGGGVLLYSSGATDTAFVRLNSIPPTGAAYAGWYVGDTPFVGSAVTGLHHPQGDLLKISFGSIIGYSTCRPPTGAEFECDPAAPNASTFYKVRWSKEGITETGSSGSGMFLDDGKYLVGAVYGGDSSCADGAVDYYGRFDVVYNAALRTWLSAAPLAPAFDYSDLWWNSGESGWGVSITQHPSRQIFAAWYVYATDGSPLWVVMSGGQWIAANVFAGDLYTTTGPDPRFAFDPARVAVTRVGTGTFTFSGSGAGTLAYVVNGVQGQRTISRQAFGAPDATPTESYSDLWWNPQESGWGVSINQQNRTLFAVWYAYGPDNRPVWYVMSNGTWTSATTYTGTLYRTSRPPQAFFGNAPFDPAAVSVTPVGTLSFTFNGTQAATMAYTVDGVSGTKALVRQSF